MHNCVIVDFEIFEILINRVTTIFAIFHGNNRTRVVFVTYFEKLFVKNW